MTESVWVRRPRPASGADAVLLGRWEPAIPAVLTAHRRELAAVLRDDARSPEADEEAVERLLLVFEELVSNALRHGRAPVRVQVTAYGHCYVLDVSDAAADRPPMPAVGRDAAHGGLGLYLVAELCGACGWTVAGDRKHVWGRIDCVRPGAPGWAPRPRSEDAHARRDADDEPGDRAAELEAQPGRQVQAMGGEESIDVVAVRVLGGYRLELSWADGMVTTVDVGSCLWGPAFERLQDPAVFRTVQVDREAGALVWPDARIRARRCSGPGRGRPGSREPHGAESTASPPGTRCPPLAGFPPPGIGPLGGHPFSDRLQAGRRAHGIPCEWGHDAGCCCC